MIKMLVAATLLGTVAPISVGASTLDDINAEEESAQKNQSELENTLNTQLAEVNKLNDEINKNETDIENQEEEIAKTADDIADKEEELADKFELAKEQARNVQLSQANQSAINMVLNAKSFSEAANLIVGLNTLFDASNDEIERVEEEAKALDELKGQQEEQKQVLAETKTSLADAKTDMNKKVQDTQELIDDNKAQLAQIYDRRAAEENRLAEAVRTKSEETKTATGQTTPTSNKNSSKRSSKKQTKTSTKQTSKQKTQSKQSSQSSKGRQITVSATAYSTNEPGMGTYTATGINLKQNPYVIAVDPSVIPLGSMVEVPGYGIRIAGDTGGAIKGKKIDIHIANLSQTHGFGRRTLTVTVLN